MLHGLHLWLPAGLHLKTTRYKPIQIYIIYHIVQFFFTFWNCRWTSLGNFIATKGEVWVQESGLKVIGRKIGAILLEASKTKTNVFWIFFSYGISLIARAWGLWTKILKKILISVFDTGQMYTHFRCTIFTF